MNGISTLKKTNLIGSGMFIKDKYIIPLILLIAADLCVFISAFVMAYFIRFYTGIFLLVPPPSPPYIPAFSSYIYLAAIIALLSVFVFSHFGFYERRVGLDRNVQVGALLLATLVTYIFIMAILFNYRGVSYSRLTVALAIPITCAGIVLAHDLLKRLQFFMIKKGIIFFKTILIGPQWRCLEINQKLQEHHGSQFQVLGYVSTDDEPERSQALIPCLGSKKQLAKILRKESVDNIVIAMSPDDPQSVLQIMKICTVNNAPFRVIPELYDHLCQFIDFQEIKAMPAIPFGETPLAFNNPGWMAKRLIDIVISSVALVVSAPLMAVIAMLIRLDSKGSIFFVQERVGNDGRTFNMYKFRSMIDHAERNTGPKWATAKDPRTTKIGRFIRKYNLDELPQFINVLRGDMSVVGPRPERPYFVNKFKEEIPYYMRRHLVKTGLTGWAQVNGWRGDTSVMERTRYDLYYVENWSLMLDLKIILKTLTSFKNAY